MDRVRNIVLITPREYYHNLPSFPLELPILFALRFLRTSRLDFKSKHAHLSLHVPPFTIFFYSPAGGNMYVCIPPDFSCVPDGLPIFPQYRDAANCCPVFLIFLMQMRTCGIIVRAFDAISRNITSLI